MHECEQGAVHFDRLHHDCCKATLSFIQGELPKLWTDALYSNQFKASPSKYKDFDHTLKHVQKATAKLIEITEEADHGAGFEFRQPEKYIADLVICALRLAVVNPRGPIDLERAVFDRIKEKMGVQLAERR